MSIPVKTWTQLPFAQTPRRTLALELRVPSAPTPPPLVMYIPMAGMRACLPKQARWWIADEGFAMACIDCRGTDEGAVAPDTVHDCKSAIRWLRANAHDYGFDGSRIGVWGHSAGGLLASLMATTGDVAELEGDGPHQGVSTRVQAAVDECGAPHDMTWFARPDIKQKYAIVTENLRLYLGDFVENRLGLARRVSPSTYLSRETAPLLLIHGDADALVPVEETVEFYEAARRVTDATLRILPGIGHSWKPELTRDDIVRFFRRTLDAP